MSRRLWASEFHHFAVVRSVEFWHGTCPLVAEHERCGLSLSVVRTLVVPMTGSLKTVCILFVLIGILPHTET